MKVKSFQSNEQPFYLVLYGLLSCVVLLSITVMRVNLNEKSVKYVTAEDIYHSSSKNLNTSDNSSLKREEIMEEEFPLCDINLPYQSGKRFATWKIGVYNSNPYASNIRFCQIIQFNIDQAVACLDRLYYENQFYRGSLEIETYRRYNKRQLKFLFLGDSRIRQHFYNFLKVK